MESAILRLALDARNVCNKETCTVHVCMSRSNIVRSHVHVLQRWLHLFKIFPYAFHESSHS
jgi:hypothetical protein